MSDESMPGEPNRAQKLEAENRALRQELAKEQSRGSNYGFLQVNKKHIDALNELAKKAPSAHQVLWKLTKIMNKQNAVMVALKDLSKLSGYSPATLKRAITLLREQQWLQVLKVGTANVYRVNSAVFWQDRADGRWSSFSAEIVVNFDEQDGFTQANPQPTLKHLPFVEVGEEVVIANPTGEGEPPPDQAQIDYHRD